MRVRFAMSLTFAVLASIASAQVPAYKSLQFVPLEITGIGKDAQMAGIGQFDSSGVARRDPSDIIRLHQQYYVFYSKILRDPNGPDDATPHPQPGFPTGYFADIWYATSKDGTHWHEQGRALDRGAASAWDSRSVFTPNVLLGKDGELYLYYTGVDDDGGPYNGFDPFNNDSVKDITQIGVARLTLDQQGLVASWTRLNDSLPILEPTYDPSYSGGPVPFDSYRVDDSALLVRDFDGDGEAEYGLYYKGRAQGGGPEGTQMGLAISKRPDGGFVRVYPDGRSIQPEGHEVMIWAHGAGVGSFISGADHGIWYSPDGIQFREVTENFEGSPRAAPGAYRPELVDHRYRGGVEWGIRHVSPHPYLAAWRETSGGLLHSKLPGDLNGDLNVNQDDLDLLAANWKQPVAMGSTYDGDLSGDGLVNQLDLDILLEHWTGRGAPDLGGIDD